MRCPKAVHALGYCHSHHHNPYRVEMCDHRITQLSDTFTEPEITFHHHDLDVGHLSNSYRSTALQLTATATATRTRQKITQPNPDPRHIPKIGSVRAMKRTIQRIRGVQKKHPMWYTYLLTCMLLLVDRRTSDSDPAPKLKKTTASKSRMHTQISSGSKVKGDYLSIMYAIDLDKRVRLASQAPCNASHTHSHTNPFALCTNN